MKCVYIRQKETGTDDRCYCWPLENIFTIVVCKVNQSDMWTLYFSLCANTLDITANIFGAETRPVVVWENETQYRSVNKLALHQGFKIILKQDKWTSNLEFLGQF